MRLGVMGMVGGDIVAAVAVVGHLWLLSGVVVVGAAVGVGAFRFGIRLAKRAWAVINTAFFRLLLPVVLVIMRIRAPFHALPPQ